MISLANPWALVLFVMITGLVSLVISKKPITVGSFFDGKSEGLEPNLWTLVFSQVTTWIFARSLMNAAILGFFYGFAGTLAYSFYYLSFLTGGFIVYRIRNKNMGSVQDWLGYYFSTLGQWTYNFLIILRLLSEVFANLIVIGLIFTDAFPDYEMAGQAAILVLAVVGFLYSAKGGLQASLRTDVFQMIIFLIVFGVCFITMIKSNDFSFISILNSKGIHNEGARPGYILILVAMLQVFSYPAHDPVMMDRGFIANQDKTNLSFILAFILSTFCIFGFGMFGIQAGIVGFGYENQLLGTWKNMFGTTVYFFLICSLLISAMSTLDSALASSARLIIDEFYLFERSIKNGRIAMSVFMISGLLFTLFPNQSLFDAVAVTGTASLFLTPVMIITFLGGNIQNWAYFITWLISIMGAFAYVCRDHEVVLYLFPGTHKYDQLLSICLYVLIIGFLLCTLSILLNRFLAKIRCD
jgi:Na+/proline symporter